jgi:hypothetical protein
MGSSAEHPRRPKGLPKTGGRKVGSLNRRTLALQKGLVAGGAPLELAEKPPRQLPLDFLLDAMNNEDLPIATRIDAARAAAPYLHHRKGLLDTSGRDVPQVINIIRFSDVVDENRPAKPEPVTIEHDLPPASR